MCSISARCMSACMPFPCCTRDPIPKLLYAARLRWEITFHGTHDHIQLKLLTIQGEKLPGHLKIASKCHMPRDYIGWEITLTGWEITWDGNLSCLTWLHLKAICQETIQDRKFYWHTWSHHKAMCQETNLDGKLSFPDIQNIPPRVAGI